MVVLQVAVSNAGKVIMRAALSLVVTVFLIEKDIMDTKEQCIMMVLVSLTALFGCKRETDVTAIICDSANAVEIDLSIPAAYQATELSPSPMMSPQHVEVPGDGSVYFYGRDSLFRYSLRDGHREVEYGRRGRARNEYVQLWDYWLDGDEVFLYDLDGGKVLRYTKDGTYLSSEEVRNAEYPFQLLCRLDGDRWVGRLTFRGDNGVTPELGLYDNGFGYVHRTGAETLRSGIRIGYPFSRNKTGVLYFGPFSDKIVQVTADSSYVRYQVVFPEGTIHRDDYKDEYEVLGRIASDQGKKEFSYLLIDVREEGNYLGFAYASSMRGPMYALHDTRQGETHVFHIKLPEGWHLSAAVLQGGRVYFVGYGEDAGTRVWGMDVKTLLSEKKQK